MKNLPSEIKAQAFYDGFIYTVGKNDTKQGYHWKQLAKEMVESGGRIERDPDAAVAIYAASGERVAEVYPS